MTPHQLKIRESVSGSIPHGGALVNRFAGDENAAHAIRWIGDSESITLDEVGVSDLLMLADGALSPLTGFMDRSEYESVVDDMRLANGLVWSIPITLPLNEDFAARLRIGQQVGLNGTAGQRLGALTVSDIWRPNLNREAQAIYRTEDQSHPGVARLFQRGNWYVGGDVTILPDARVALNLNGRYQSPRQLRQLFSERGWRKVVAFQTRNPIHRAHEYIQKCALETVDGLLIHPLVGHTKSDDIPPDVRLQSYDALLANYYPHDRTVLSVFPAAMRYAGPREAVFHAIARKNYGCTHFIVGRDHAGVGSFYGTYDAQRIFDTIPPDELGVTILTFDHTFYCRRCEAIVSSKTCPHDTSYHVVFSGTQIRTMLSRGEPLPTEYSRPEVVAVLMAHARGAA